MARPDPRGVAGGAIALAVLIAAPFAQDFEGFVPKARPDPVGIPTYCHGETENVDPTRVYTKSECGVLLRARMAKDYAPPLLKCVPDLAKPEHRNALAASIDGAYNFGPVAFCGGPAIKKGKHVVLPMSPMAKAFNAGDWVGGCKAFKGFYVTANGIPLRGLVRRREAEAALCSRI